MDNGGVRAEYIYIYIYMGHWFMEQLLFVAKSACLLRHKYFIVPDKYELQLVTVVRVVEMITIICFLERKQSEVGLKRRKVSLSENGINGD